MVKHERGLTLEQRIERLESILLEQEESNKTPDELLTKLSEMLFKNKVLNPDGVKASDHSSIRNYSSPTLIVDDTLGKWIVEIEPPAFLSSESWDELKKVVGTFCKINKCLIDIKNKDSRREINFALKRYPGMVEEPAKSADDRKGTPVRRSNRYSDELDYSDPEYQGMKKASRWRSYQRSNGYGNY